MSFLSRIFSRRSPDDAPLPEPDARLAVGALLVRVAFSDRAYLVEEISMIDRILGDSYDLNPVEAAKMRATCEKLVHQAPETAKFAELVRDEIPYQDRLRVVEAMWSVAMADGLTDEAEASTVATIEDTLGIERADSEAARAKVAA